MRRKSVFSLIIVTVIAAMFTVVALAGDKDKKEKAEMADMKEVTVTGLLIDTKCYGMNHDNYMADHMTPKGKMTNCAQACANMGIPVGVLVDGNKGGQVFILITPAQALAEHMAKTVKVVGMKTFKGAVTPNQVFVKNAEGEWEEVKIATMM
ncbi:MAG: hypothetical protein OEN01_01805 [Candidatus Krumholzibacteria bacterium]|nr:hypothetical protein [Candidatus Krumholzibacteria bacterium]